MEKDTSFIEELVGKLVWITTEGGTGTKDASKDNYKGTLLGFDGRFVKLEYVLKKFTEGTSVVVKGTIIINISYLISIEDYKESLNV